MKDRTRLAAAKRITAKYPRVFRVHLTLLSIIALLRAFGVVGDTAELVPIIVSLVMPMVVPIVLDQAFWAAPLFESHAVTRDELRQVVIEVIEMATESPTSVVDTFHA